MGSPTVTISEIPPDFCPVCVQHDDVVVCHGHNGVALELAFELTCDPVENARRMERFRNDVWWHLEMIRLGIDPDVEGHA